MVAVAQAQSERGSLCHFVREWSKAEHAGLIKLLWGSTKNEVCFYDIDEFIKNVVESQPHVPLWWWQRKLQSSILWEANWVFILNLCTFEFRFVVMLLLLFMNLIQSLLLWWCFICFHIFDFICSWVVLFGYGFGCNFVIKCIRFYCWSCREIWFSIFFFPVSYGVDVCVAKREGYFGGC